MTELELRDYQHKCLDHAKKANTIVHLPTGFGKTLIAARLVDHYLALQPKGLVGFLVPTLALADQQSNYLVEHCRRATGQAVVVQPLVGDEQSAWSSREWLVAMNSCDIFCGTAALFQKAFITDRYMDIGRFSLLVFDECHNATGKSPMASVMRDAVAPYYLSMDSRDSPRILGLTASFDNGNSKNLAKKRRQMETLLQSTIICPVVQERIQDNKFQHVQWERNPIIEEQKEKIEEFVKNAVAPLANIQEISKVIYRCSHVFEQLGHTALFFYINKVILQQISEKIKYLESRYEDHASVGCAARMKRFEAQLRLQLASLHECLESDMTLQHADEKSQKLIRLIDLLEEIFQKRQEGFRGIVFVEQVALVSTLAKLLNDAFCDREFGAVAGGSSQCENDRQKQLDKFAVGEIDCLVSTAALEEGIDVSNCGFVVRYTSVSTTKAHIQGAHPRLRPCWSQGCRNLLL